MSVLDRFIGELQALRSRVALESLENPILLEIDASLAYGRAVGRLEGLKLAEETLNRLLSESDEVSESGGRRFGKAREKV